MSGSRNRIVIAGTGSGAGKTTVTIGLMAAMKRRGLCVQGFKCGPDYIDPTYHTAVTGRPSRNLDTWMMSRDIMREIFLRASEGTEVSVIEGVMGLYDGSDPLSNSGSTAEIAALLESPVILVVNARSMARSAAAVVLGYKKLDESIRIAGVILNQCGSPGHYRLIKSAIEQECGIPVVGWVQRDGGLGIPERHLGLVPAIERGELDGLFNRAADLVEEGVDIGTVLSLAGTAPALGWPKERLFHVAAAPPSAPRIAVARDAAFNFYYRENLELLEQYGARLVYFSPLAGDTVPGDAHGLYLGGGFPEEYAARLSADERAKRDLRVRVQDGLPVFAECGGYMYLSRSITDRAGETHAMVGVIPADVTMQNKLAALGYREARALSDCLLMEDGEVMRGHEFHYSRLAAADPANYPYVYQTTGLRGTGIEGYYAGNVMAGYTHLHFASHPQAAKRFIERCLQYSRKRSEAGGADDGTAY